jgi:hypothetical protein
MGMRAGGKVKGERLKGKGKKNKFNLSPFPRLVSLSNHTPFPFPIPCLPNIIFTGATRDHKY